MNIFELFKTISQEKKDRQPVTYLVAGLGNPGTKYQNTRHNAGFQALETLGSKYGSTVDRLRFHALVGECTIGTCRILLMKPQTFMNASGEAIQEAANWYKIAPDHIIILCDDITLDVGRLRVRRKGSHGGHNGLKSIIQQLGTDEFPRIRIGVGIPPKDYDIVDWVLGQFDTEDRKTMADSTTKAAEAVVELLLHGVEAAANQFNGK